MTFDWSDTFKEMASRDVDALLRRAHALAIVLTEINMPALQYDNLWHELSKVWKEFMELHTIESVVIHTGSAYKHFSLKDKNGFILVAEPGDDCSKCELKYALLAICTSTTAREKFIASAAQKLQEKMQNK